MTPATPSLKGRVFDQCRISNQSPCSVHSPLQANHRMTSLLRKGNDMTENLCITIAQRR